MKQYMPTGSTRTRYFGCSLATKKAILELYNALNGTDYQDPDDLTVTTLENAVYMAMKNDVSFLLDARMTLYEHQSTWNPNMPLRDLLYIARLMERMWIRIYCTCPNR